MQGLIGRIFKEESTDNDFEFVGFIYWQAHQEACSSRLIIYLLSQEGKVKPIDERTFIENYVESNIGFSGDGA